MGAASVTSATLAGHIMNYPPSKYSIEELRIAYLNQYECFDNHGSEYFIKTRPVEGNVFQIQYPHYSSSSTLTIWIHGYQIDLIPQIDAFRQTKLGKLLCP